MATAALMGASIGANALGTIFGNIQRSKAAEAAMKEQQRQQNRMQEQAREQRSDIARDADREIATALAIASDGGGTGASAARLGSAIAGIAGLSIGRVDSNLMEAMAASRAEQKAIQHETRTKNILSVIKFVGSSAEMLAGRSSPATKDPSSPAVAGKVGGKASGKLIISSKTGKLGGRV